MTVAGLGQRGGQFFQLGIVDPALTPGDFFRACHFQALALFQRLNKLARFQHGIMRAGIQPGIATTHQLDIQLALLAVKLPHLDADITHRRQIADFYQRELAGLPLVLPKVRAGAEPVWHLYVVQSERRDALQQALATAGVGTLIHYPVPPHRQGAYAELNLPEGSLPVAEAIHRQVLSLPMGPTLALEHAAVVVQACRDFFAKG